MNKIKFKLFNTYFVLLVLSGGVSMAQIDNVDFLRAGASDGMKIIKAYISPWANAFGAGLNGGWYNTAKPHKLGGFDITTSINIGVVPKSAGTFNVSDLNLKTLQGSGTSPTISGPDIEGPKLTKTENGIELASFSLPPGTGWRYIPAPTLQAGIGLPFGTEIKVRFIPKINMKENGSLGLWGVGIMHSIIQYLPGSKLLPLDVSLFGGYTKLNGDIAVSLQPDPEVPQNYSIYNISTSFNDQNISSTVKALNFGLLGSANIAVLNIYGGIGYSNTKTKVALEGNFPTPVLVAEGTPHAEYNDSGVLKGSDIEPLEIKNFSGMRFNIGLRIKLAFMTIHADYTKANYNVFSGGIGISFR
ncbi:MAG TPA: hypothetical protein PLN06_03370 [Bacteroidales bacterium]|nr:hypothetical protein [Bacteroidales bacterium]HOU95647.1 hypothetical protein [Bacteroidales bacterium]HQG36028.1 hypothetical protein [Bacteroidales bacterium]HQG53166.1 hypothetical protein [Bacteroidales bacterium]HQJ20344.1 hypothetical protein [Bacteroidales bacterium]